MDTTRAVLSYGLNQHTLEIFVETATDPTSVSDHYLSIHLPSYENQSKSFWDVTGDGKTRLETIYDQTSNDARVEVLITSGATQYPVTVAVSLYDGQSRSLTGSTGVPIITGFALPF